MAIEITNFVSQYCTIFKVKECEFKQKCELRRCRMSRNNCDSRNTVNHA